MLVNKAHARTKTASAKASKITRLLRCGVKDNNLFFAGLFCFFPRVNKIYFLLVVAQTFLSVRAQTRMSVPP